MRTRVIPYNHGLTPSFDSKLPVGTEVFVNKVPWDWHIHVRIKPVEDELRVTVWNAEVPEGEVNPNMDDFYQLIWFEESFSEVSSIRDKFEYLGIIVPDGLWDRVGYYSDNKELFKKELT